MKKCIKKDARNVKRNLSKTDQALLIAWLYADNAPGLVPAAMEATLEGSLRLAEVHIGLGEAGDGEEAPVAVYDREVTATEDGCLRDSVSIWPVALGTAES